MTRVGRSRTRTKTFRGKRKRFDSNGTIQEDTPVVVNFLDQCNDSHGRPVIPSSLVSRQYKNILRLDGFAENISNNQRYVYEGVPFFQGSGEIEDTTTLPVKTGWELDLIAGTNPSRPVLTPPMFLQDILTLPALLRETGQALTRPRNEWSPRQAANAYLAAKFGWFPLIDDLRKLLDLQSYVLKRTKELNQLYSGQGLRRRLKFNEDTKVYKQSASWAHYGTGKVTVPISVTVSKQQWGTIRWHPTEPPQYLPGDDRMHNLARRLVLGLTVEGMAKGSWDVIPWTWLLGWFTNLGKYTLYHSNTVPAGWSDCCLMNQVVLTATPGSVIVVGANKYKLDASGQRTFESKNRLVGSGTVLPGFNMPFLDMSRLSVLGALFAQRFMR